MKHTFKVEGMHCEQCEKTISRAIRQLDRAAEVTIDRSENKVEVASTLPAQALIQAMVEEGFNATA